MVCGVVLRIATVDLITGFPDDEFYGFNYSTS
jgi:hypothetical protein